MLIRRYVKWPRKNKPTPAWVPLVYLGMLGVMFVLTLSVIVVSILYR